MFTAALADAFNTVVRYSRDHHDVNSLAAALPFAATRASDNGVLHPHRAALADALWEAGRDDEAQIAADPTKHLAVEHYPDGEEWGVEEWRGSRQHSRRSAISSYLSTALWTHPDDEQIDSGSGALQFTDEAEHKAAHAISKFMSRLSPAARAEAESRPGTAADNVWLTRNGHRRGFRDSDFEHRSEMHAAAKSLGEQHVEFDPQPNSDATDADGVQLHLSGGRE